MSVIIENRICDVVANSHLNNLEIDGFDIHIRTRFFSEPSEMILGKRREFEKLFSVLQDDEGYIVNFFIHGQETKVKISDRPYNAKKFALYLAKQYADRHDIEFRDNTF